MESLFDSGRRVREARADGVTLDAERRGFACGVAAMVAAQTVQWKLHHVALPMVRRRRVRKSQQLHTTRPAALRRRGVHRVPMLRAKERNVPRSKREFRNSEERRAKHAPERRFPSPLASERNSAGNELTKLGLGPYSLARPMNKDSDKTSQAGDLRKSASPQDSRGHLQCLAIGPADIIPPRPIACAQSRHWFWQPDNRRRRRLNLSVRAEDDPGTVSGGPGNCPDGLCGPRSDPRARRNLPRAAVGVPCGQPSRSCAAAGVPCGAQDGPRAVPNRSCRGSEASRHASVVPCGFPIHPCAGGNDSCAARTRPGGPFSAQATDLLIPQLTLDKPPSNQERN